MSDDETEADIVLQLDALATYAERANHWTDDKRLMDAAGVADTIYGAIERIEELEANALANRVAIMRLEAKLAKVVEVERERCAKVAESVALPMDGRNAKAQADYMSKVIASAIRAELKGQKDE